MRDLWCDIKLGKLRITESGNMTEYPQIKKKIVLTVGDKGDIKEITPRFTKALYKLIKEAIKEINSILSSKGKKILVTKMKSDQELNKEYGINA